MWEYIAIHAARWDYQPSPGQITACLKYLQEQGVLGPLHPGESDRYAVGPKCEELLGVQGDWATISVAPHLFIECGPLEAACPHCGAEVDNWSELFGLFAETETEPDHLCPGCRHATPLTGLTYSPGAAFGYFMITFTEAGALQANTESPVWAEMERLLGTKLTFTYYLL